MTINNEYLTPPAIAKRLGISPDRVIGWIRRGELRGSISPMLASGRDSTSPRST